MHSRALASLLERNLQVVFTGGQGCFSPAALGLPPRPHWIRSLSVIRNLLDVQTLVPSPDRLHHDLWGGAGRVSQKPSG